MRHHAPEPIELASTNGGWQEMTVTGAKKNSQGRDNLFSKLGQTERALGGDVYEMERRHANIQRVPAECGRLPKARERDERILSEDGPARNGRRVPHDGGRSQSAFYPEPPPPIRHCRGHERSVQKDTIREAQSHGWRGPQGFVNATHVVMCDYSDMCRHAGLPGSQMRSQRSLN